MGWWSLNPYIGCEFGCTYCYARYAHRYASERARDAGFAGAEPADQAPSWRAFETRIFVKRRAAVVAALGRALPRLLHASAAGDRSIVIGSATDPYQPAERSFAVTRAVLERLRHERGLRISIITKSPLIARDATLLAELGQRHTVSVAISLMSVDPTLIRAFEPRSPLPHARLRALRRLVALRVRAGVLVAPVLPGVTDTTARLRKLLQQARAAGAHFAHASPFRMYPGLRGIFFPALEAVNPALVRRYHARYRDVGAAPPEYRAALAKRFAELSAAAGFASETLPSAPDAAPSSQLALWNL